MPLSLIHILYDRLTVGYLLGTGDKYARYYTANAYTEQIGRAHV